MNNCIREEASNIPVYDECDVLIVGGGCAGHSAAIAAARAGCKNIVLMERYGYMGGDVTGGYVIMVPNLSWYNKSFVRGLQEEWFTRLAKIPGAVRAPSLDDIGITDDKALLRFWGSLTDCVSRGGYGGSKPPCLVRAVYYEPNQLKVEMDHMLAEHSDSIRVYCHCWGTKPIIDNNEMKGVIFESKQGRQAILARIVIDATGDGDIYSRAGVPFQSLADAQTRSSTTALVWRVAGIDWDAYHQWRTAYPECEADFRANLVKRAGYRTTPIGSNDRTMFWMNNWHANRDCTIIKDQTFTEMTTRTSIRRLLEYMREAVPAFKNAYLYDIAPQLGTRCSRRLTGEYVMTANDFAFAIQHDDVVAWHSTICQINDCGPVEIPYRALLAKGVDNLLAPGRHLSADDVAIDWLNLIPQCVGTGQAAGVAAAVAIKDGTGAHDVNIRKVQDILVDQDVPLPRNAKFHAKDPSYEELAEEKQYGLYTDNAKKAREEIDRKTLNGFRQW